MEVPEKCLQSTMNIEVNNSTYYINDESERFLESKFRNKWSGISVLNFALESILHCITKLLIECITCYNNIIIIFIDEYKEQKYKIHQYRFKGVQLYSRSPNIRYDSF